MSQMKWDPVKPGLWQSGNYTAARRASHSRWDLLFKEEPLYKDLASCEQCRKEAQRHDDKLNTVAPEIYPVHGITKVEIIDHRPGAAFRGKAFSADVERTELKFQDDMTTLKVVLT